MGAQLCSEAADTCEALLRARPGEASCAGEFSGRDLSGLYLRLLELRLRFLLGSALGDEEMNNIKKTFEADKDPNDPDASEEKREYHPPSQDGSEAGNVLVEPSLANRRLFALDEMPDIGRCVRTFVDVELPAQEVWKEVASIHGVTDGTAYLFIRLAPNGLSKNKDEAKKLSRWSLAKLVMDGQGGVARFLPATREELILALRGTSAGSEDLLPQRDGVVLLGRQAANGSPLYELVSANLRAAARDFEKRGDRMLTQALAAGTTRVACTGGESKPEAIEWPDVVLEDIDDDHALHSGGFAVVNFACASQLSQSVGAAGVGMAAACDDCFLDASDFMIGRVPFLGLPVGEIGENGAIVVHRHEWRPLTRKVVRYDDVAGGSLEKAVEGFYESGERENAAVTNDRLAPRTAKLQRQAVAAVDENEMTFLGEPAGLDTTLLRHEVPVNDEVDIRIGRHMSLPRRGAKGVSDEQLVPALRFGMFARMGYAAAYLGGASIKAAEAARIFDNDPVAAVPRRSATEPVLGRRHLRSEPTEAVEVLMPKDEADREVAAYRRFRSGGAPPPWAPQTTGMVVLRTKVEEDGTRRSIGEEEILRIVTPPVLPLDFAERHGVFDEVPQPVFPCKPARIESEHHVPRWRNAYHDTIIVRRPADGLSGIHFDAAWGGFPVLRRDRGASADRIAILDAAFDDGATWLHQAKTWSLTAQDRTPKNTIAPTPTGDGVFASRRWKRVDQGRTVPFYPDPMAQELVLRMRRSASPFEPSDGPCATVRLVEAERYPSVLPVAIFIRRTETASTIEVTKDEVVIEGKRCRKVIVRLAPGERYELDLWCRPSVPALVAWSELIDTAATLWREGSLGEIKGLPECPPEVCGELTNCGLSGRQAAGREALNALAKTLHARLCERPIPQLARVRTISVIHATTRPVRTPEPSQLAVRRALTAEQGGKGQSLGEVFLREDAPPAPPPAWFLGGDSSANIAPGGTEVDLAGTVMLHVPSTEALEVIATGIAPFGEGFDDTARRREESDILSGTFRKTEGADGNERFLGATEIYGFRVSRKGFVTLERRQALWAKFGNIAKQVERGIAPSGMAKLSLHALFARAVTEALAEGTTESVTSEIHPLFADTRARRIDIQFRAVSGHAPAFSSRPFIRNGYYEPAMPQKPSDISVSTVEQKTLWIPASARPASPVAAAEAHPGTRFLVRRPPASEPTVHVHRLASVRLWLARPWFSSGEGERLGVILWPPVNHRQVYRLWKKVKLVARPSLQESGEESVWQDHMYLPSMNDEDIAGIGPYLSRWGSDPIEDFPATGWRDWIIPNEVFADLAFDAVGDVIGTARSDASLVRDVPMPIPSTSSSEKAEGDDEGKVEEDGSPPPIQRYLPVDLIAYTPRFDIDREEWYVDVTLNPGPMVSPFVRLGVVRYQEHAPRDLKVSFPGDPFHCQILTRRSTTVCVSGGGVGGRQVVHVLVRGPASAEPPGAGVVQSAPIDAAVATRMHVRIVGTVRQTGALHFQAEDWLSPTAHWRGPPHLAADSSDGGVTSETGDMTWATAFDVPTEALDPSRFDVKVHVQEWAHRPPATRTPGGANHGAASPRYLCMVDVPHKGGAHAQPLEEQGEHPTPPVRCDPD